MAELFKDKFNTKTVTHLAKVLVSYDPSFNLKEFIKMASAGLAKLEMKARSKQITKALLVHMPQDFTKATQIIESALDKPSQGETLNFEHAEGYIAGWTIMPVVQYISDAILLLPDERFELGMQSLKECTKRFSAEFAIRPLLEQLQCKTLAVLETWAHDSNLHVRRLVSEGSRPLLPWGLRLHAFVQSPQLILPLLEQLKDDESEYVRRSVANSLNDIAKHHPDLVANIALKWWQDDKPIRQKLLKHACRTLIKKGNVTVLNMLGYAPASIQELELTLAHTLVVKGNEQVITLHIKNAISTPQKLLIDYVVHHQKANGTLSPKVFKWKSVVLPVNNGGLTLTKKHSFKTVTTRKYYSGKHKISILINGETFAEQAFSLT
ncbi:DNA alkylation repair protein [Glaciecola sp. 2405UD65-10]|uniref:DNA alkylation repair protein n=1 Tax=Glaciecola sp. 2405UD65-10 TaxID=3397244 RepID=UPI003B5C6445